MDKPLREAWFKEHSRLPYSGLGYVTSHIAEHTFRHVTARGRRSVRSFGVQDRCQTGCDRRRESEGAGQGLRFLWCISVPSVVGSSDGLCLYFASGEGFGLWRGRFFGVNTVVDGFGKRKGLCLVFVYRSETVWICRSNSYVSVNNGASKWRIKSHRKSHVRKLTQPSNSLETRGFKLQILTEEAVKFERLKG